MKPTIMSIDDDPVVLRAVERDLRSRYGQDYRIVPINLARSALDYLHQMNQRNETVALFLVDQRMPQMNGVEFLNKARKIFPEAKKVLLTAYADTDAAISSINEVGLDYYLMKPWNPPEDLLYPILDDLLEDWRVNALLPYEGIRVAGSLWSPASHDIKEFLTRHQIPYQWLDVETDMRSRSLAEEANQGELIVPTIFLPEGDVLVDPSIQELAERIGLQTHASRPFYDLVIVGGGPAGLSAAVYASSEGLRCLLVEKHSPGGQAGSSPKIENYLGFPGGISGMDLARRAITQARRLGAEILLAQEAQEISVRDNYRIVRLNDGSEVSCHAVLLATGASYNTLNIPGISPLTGAGVYFGAAYTEATYYKGQDVFVIGGANSAAQGALYLSRFASQVYVIYRGKELKASKYLVDTMQQNEKITIMLETELIEVHGKDHLEDIVIKDVPSGELRTMLGGALFIFIGVKPQSNLVSELALMDDHGYVVTGPDLLQNGHRPKEWGLKRNPYMLETSIPGIFAAGDVRSGTNHRVASATGEAGVAIAMIREYLKTL